MAESADVENKTLSEIFKDGFDLYTKIDSGAIPFNSDEFQNDVKRALRYFEDSTRLVNSLGMFSTNEIIDEIPTEHLRYLLLPYFLGQLSTKCVSYDREEALGIAKIYYKDFLKRCEDYGICKPKTGKGASSEMDLLQMAQHRNSKIEVYRRKKDLEEQVRKMKVAIANEHADEEIKREFYLKLIDLSIIGANEETESVEQEMEIVDFRKRTMEANKQSGRIKAQDNRPSTPLRPIIITKNAAQKAVFGMGYPSLPIMSVDEFYDQRVREGIFPNEEQVAAMNEKMLNPEDPDEKEEKERAEKDVMEENDDPEHLGRQRRFDEYKDVVRRGDGNRYNRS